MSNYEIRDEITKLSDEELIDELTRPTGIWDKDVVRESLRRILSNLCDIVKLCSIDNEDI